MNRYLCINEFKSFKKVTFYTVQFEDKDVSETDDFIVRFKDDKKSQESLYNLMDWLKDIGDKRGAQLRYFRPEDDAFALPPRAKELAKDEKHDLRLYCYVINESCVILFNGCHKTAKTVRDCPNCHPKLRFAKEMSKQIKDSIDHEFLIVNGSELSWGDEFYLEY